MTSTPPAASPPVGAARATVVVVEDEPVIAEAVAARLRADGHRVEVAHDVPAGVELCRRVRPDLVVLDLLLPGVDGYEVCRRVQAEQPVPVLVLTALDDEADVVVGLRVGADDYLTKPFGARELSARVAAPLRRAARGDAPRDRLRLGEVELDLSARLARRAGAAVHLTATELDLLARLAERPGAVLSREQPLHADTAHLSTLSADAVPALLELDEPARGCVLEQVRRRLPRTGWTSANLSRARAARLLDDRAPGACGRRAH